MKSKIIIGLVLILACGYASGQNIRGNSLWSHTTITADSSYVPTENEKKGDAYYDVDNDTWSIVTEHNVYQVGQELAPLFKNVSGRTMYNGEVAYYAGAVGASEHIEFTSAALDGTFLPSRIVGILTEDIPDNGWGKVTWFGGIRNFDINNVRQSTDGAWAVDDILYASNTEESKMTNVMPNAPYYTAEMCVILSINGSNVTVFTRPTWNWKLSDMADVDGADPTTTGDLLTFDQISGVWDRGVYSISNEAFSDNWEGKDTIVPTFDNLYAKISLFEALNYCADSAVVNFGTIESGTQDSLCAVDGNDLVIAERAANPPFQVDFVFQGVERLQFFSFYGDYDGGQSHQVHVSAYNVNTLSWDFIGEFGASAVKRWYSFPIYLPNNYIDNGEVKIRVEHQGSGITAHRMIFDYVEVNFGGTGGGNFITAGSVDFMPYMNITSGNVQGAIQQFYDLWEDTTTVLRGDISALQAESHPAVTLTGTPDYVTINPTTQVITRNQIDLTSDVTGLLTDSNVSDDLTINTTKLGDFGSVRASLGDDYARLNYNGVQINRSVGYLGPATNGTNTLFIGGSSKGTADWVSILLYGTGTFRWNDNDVWHSGNFTDNSTEWNTAYTHSQIITGNPHNILANQITDFSTEVSNNPSVLANTGKDTTGIYHVNRSALDLVSGTNTGNETLSSIQSLVSNDFHNLGGVDIDNQTLSIDSTGRLFTISISNENSVSFEDTNTQLTDGEISAFGFIKNADETDQVYSGDSANIVWFSDLLDNDPTNEIQDTSEIDGLLQFVQNYSIDSYTETDPIFAADSANIVHFDELDYFTGADITGNESAFDGWDKNVADDFSGDYNDLTNKPVIPTVNDSVITLQRNGVEIGNFSLNQNFQETFNFIDENTTYTSSDFDHNALTNTHNLTTDINHDQLFNFLQSEHFTQAEISITESQISDFGDYVPYTGANKNLNLGTYALNAGDVTISEQLAFAAATGDKISLFDDRIGFSTMYGFGIESGTLYSRIPIGTTFFRWYFGLNDGGVSDAMQLSLSGLEHVQGSLDSHSALLGDIRNAVEDADFLSLAVNGNSVWHTGNLTPSDYLSRSGGTMLNTSLVTNLNAQYLNGIYSGRVIYGGNQRGTTAEDSDLNNLLKSGFYASSSSAANRPTSSGSDGYASLHTQWDDSDQFAFQISESINNGLGLYHRRKYNGVWYDWYRVWDENNLSSLSDLNNDLVISDFPNDLGYLTSETDPTVNNPTITLQRNGVSIGNFTLNQVSDESFNFIDENTTYTSSDFVHNSLTGLNDGTTYQHITTTQESNFETAYSYSQIGHLPLSGGTMSNTNIVNNLNAQFISGVPLDRIIYGSGVRGSQPEDSDLNTILKSGFYGSSSGTLNAPISGTNTLLHVQFDTSDDAAFQLDNLYGSDNRFFVRGKHLGTWNSWVELKHTGNFTDNSTNWNTAYDDKINSIGVSGTTTKTITLNQQDGTTLTANFTDLQGGWADGGTYLYPTNDEDILLSAVGAPEILMRDESYASNYYSFGANAGGSLSLNYSTNGSTYSKGIELTNTGTIFNNAYGSGSKEGAVDYLLGVASDGEVREVSVTPQPENLYFSGSSVYANSTQTATSSGTILSFGGEQYDTDAYHDVGTTSRLTMPTFYASSSIAKVTISLQFKALSNFTGKVELIKNGTTTIREWDLQDSGLTGQMSVYAAENFLLSSGDYLQIKVTTTINTTSVTSVNLRPQFSVELLKIIT